jgi:DMSO/TMAO reductase YedYZ molybdopterin-dependent catalytic subunit
VVAGRITPIDELYRQTYSPQIPDIDITDWSLAVEGEAASPLQLSWQDLQAFDAVERMHTLECIGNPIGGRLIGNVNWRGVPLRAVLERAAPSTSATHLVMSSADEYFTCVPLELAADERSLLAFEANGDALPRAHGHPVRVLLPGVYGQKQPKWVISLRLADRYVQGTWEKDGWSDTAAIQINSRIEHPPANGSLPAGEPVVISGVAFSDLSGVARVEISTDGGETWNEATLYPGPEPTVWTIWDWDWPAATPGNHVVQARSTDGNGKIQQPAGRVLGGVFPDGTSGIHEIVVTVA